MFFSISAEPKNNFLHHYRLGDFCVDTDSGWHQVEVNDYTVIYKGYADCARLQDLLKLIIDQENPFLTGNFCVLAFNRQTQEIKVLTDLYRSFPLFFDNEKSLNNLIPVGNKIWANNQITILPKIHLKDNIIDIIGTINNTELDFDDALEQIDTILSLKVQEFLNHNQLPIRVFLSGGVDTLLVYSYLKKYAASYDLVKCQHIDYDHFYLSNSGDLLDYWAYKQIHHWVQPCILTSGTSGDEFMLRSPTTVAAYMKARGIDPIAELTCRPNCLHWDYFNQSKHIKLFQDTEPKTDWELCNIVANDYQHWHLGNTLTWTPLRDIEIFKLTMRLPITNALDQIFNSALSRCLIERNVPGLTSAISDRKNSKNMMKNLVGLLL